MASDVVKQALRSYSDAEDNLPAQFATRTPLPVNPFPVNPSESIGALLKGWMHPYGQVHAPVTMIMTPLRLTLWAFATMGLELAPVQPGGRWHLEGGR